MHRKEFIKTACLTCLGSSSIASLLQSCATTNYFAQSSVNSDVITVSKSEFINVAKKKTQQRKYVLIKAASMSFPVCVYKLGEDEFSALLMECTHKGCELQPHGEYLTCPCHGSEFSNRGIVQNPPAERNLQTFKTTSDHDNIYIHL